MISLSSRPTEREIQYTLGYREAMLKNKNKKKKTTQQQNLSPHKNIPICLMFMSLNKNKSPTHCIKIYHCIYLVQTQ